MHVERVAILLGAAHGALLCNQYTGGTCKVSPCNSGKEGDAFCDGGLCKCKWGSCAYARYCQKPKGCDKRTIGTCRLLPCSDLRGWTDCNDGVCVCQADACQISGKCEKSCEYRTGGTCNVQGCRAERHALCDPPGQDYWGYHGNRCICGEGSCATTQGICHKGVWLDVGAMNTSMTLASVDAPTFM
mmetsp:Transcript_15377/g.27459  ORF Transcript_15377/g.27459 Transcript_15377/m.27459 type:complete len:187 (+) Transcript_15377:75-635(+)